jgi:NAD(P)H-nitrite reductase large subunit
MNDKKTIVCRCEDLTLEDIQELIKKGYKSVDEIKRISRCGMGPCQGRTCRDIVLREIARAEGKDVSELKMSTFRPPVKPIKLGLIERGEE